MGIPRGESQDREDVQARVHAGDDGDLLRALGRQAAQGTDLGRVGVVPGQE